MKKSTFVSLSLLVALATANAQDLRPRAKVRGNTFSAPISQHYRTRPVAQTPPASQVQGGIVEGVRSGNPLQMVNPLAPREYGSGQRFVSVHDDDPQQGPKNYNAHSPGWVLFSVEF